MADLLTIEAFLSLATLTILEIVLGIDNIVFISVVTQRLHEDKRTLARKLGLGAALITRLMLLSSLAWMVKLTNPLFSILQNDFSMRDIILISGGLFLLWKSTKEIHELTEPETEEDGTRKYYSFWNAIAQIAVIDIIFSLDSVITAIGMANQLSIMMTAVIVAVIIMLFAVNPISHFVHKHPTTKMLAFAMLIMIGISLIADGFDIHIPRGYLYFAISFSLFVEMLNIYGEKKRSHHKKITTKDNLT